MNNDKIYNAIKGLRVDSIDIRSGEECLFLKFNDKQVLRLALIGDCCSYSYFTDVNQFKELEGCIINDIEDRRGKSEAAYIVHCQTEDSMQSVEDSGDSTSWHFLVFTTDKGHVTIDWRNDSNGWYDGELQVDLLSE